MLLLNHKFNVLSGVNRDEFADMKLVTECGQSLSLHRVVGASVSKTIRDLLASKASTELSIRNVKFAALNNLVNFIYEGKVTLDDRCDLQDFAAAYMILKVNLGAKVNSLVNNIDTGMQPSEDDSQTEDTPNLTCYNCGKIFTDKVKFQRHVREVHRKGQEVSKKQTYECENCGKIYTVQRDVRFCKCKTKKRNRSSNLYKDPWNGCDYKCGICGKQFDMRGKLRSHVVQIHGMNYKEFLTQHDPVLHSAKWKCLVCSSVVTFERSSATSHLKLHNLTIAQYEAIHGAPVPVALPEEPGDVRVPSPSANVASSAPVFNNCPASEPHPVLPPSIQPVISVSGLTELPPLQQQSVYQFQSGIVFARKSIPAPQLQLDSAQAGPSKPYQPGAGIVHRLAFQNSPDFEAEYTSSDPLTQDGRILQFHEF